MHTLILLLPLSVSLRLSSSYEPCNALLTQFITLYSSPAQSTFATRSRWRDWCQTGSETLWYFVSNAPFRSQGKSPAQWRILASIGSHRDTTWASISVICRHLPSRKVPRRPSGEIKDVHQSVLMSIRRRPYGQPPRRADGRLMDCVRLKQTASIWLAAGPAQRPVQHGPAWSRIGPSSCSLIYAPAATTYVAFLRHRDDVRCRCSCRRRRSSQTWCVC